jgi:3-dehydroquinate synthase
METIHVNLRERSYDILVQSGGLSRVGDWLRSFSLSPKVLMVMDEHTASLFGDSVRNSLQAAGFLPVETVISPGEISKSLVVADQLYDAAIRGGLDRGSAVLALGGGVVGDLSGFVAATYMRGVPFFQVPTTLLAQVDSSVGGKVAVNHALGKNLIGAFYQPRGVLIDPRTLCSLPEREFASGMAEVIKYGFILDKAFLRELADNAPLVKGRDAAALERVISRCCRMKAAIVERDEQDVGERMLLNFGHTAGHALEAAGCFERFTHGEGVALGMLVAARLSELEALIAPGGVEAVQSLLKLYDLPVKAQGCTAADALRHMGTDKKQEAGRLRWILLEQVGCATICSNISRESVLESLQVVL